MAQVISMNRSRDLLKRFRAIARGLNAWGALNYTASFELFFAEGEGTTSFEEILKSCLGRDARLGGSVSTTLSDVISQVQEAITYRGELGTNPNLQYLDSEKGKREITEAVQALVTFIEGAEVMAEIRIAEGHPFYPVYWDFAFVFVLGADAYVFIGSVSD